jgi:predicted  nucleic acid-binding Zn-ribbon protein
MEVSGKQSGAARRLFELQALDQEIEAARRSLETVRSKLGTSQALASARLDLAAWTKRLEDLARGQQALEWEIEDYTGKISELEKKLYSGKVTNPKELTGLQQDAESLKTRRKEKEDRALEIMEQREAASVGVRERQVYLTGVEEAWRTEQAALEKEAGELALRIESLERQRQEFRAGLEAGLVEQYDKLKAQKGSAVAGVEQGICRGCRISLSQAQLRQVRTGALARCGNCGRILYLA